MSDIEQWAKDAAKERKELLEACMWRTEVPETAAPGVDGWPVRETIHEWCEANCRERWITKCVARPSIDKAVWEVRFEDVRDLVDFEQWRASLEDD